MVYFFTLIFWLFGGVSGPTNPQVRTFEAGADSSPTVKEVRARRQEGNVIPGGTGSIIILDDTHFTRTRKH